MLIALPVVKAVSVKHVRKELLWVRLAVLRVRATSTSVVTNALNVGRIVQLAQMVMVSAQSVPSHSYSTVTRNASVRRASTLTKKKAGASPVTKTA